MQINEVQVVVPQPVPNIANTGTAGQVIPENPAANVTTNVTGEVNSGPRRVLAPPLISRQASAKSATTTETQAQQREQQSGTDLADLTIENRENLIADLRAFFYVQDTGRVVIHVVDDENQLVRQFPADALLELAEFMGKMVDHLFDEVV